MGVAQFASQHAAAVGGQSGYRQGNMEVVREPGQSYEIPNPDVSDFERANNATLDFLESDTFNYAVTGATVTYVAGSAAATTIAAGGTVAAASTAAATALLPIAVGAAAGYWGFQKGAAFGSDAADLVMGDMLGMKKIATEGDAPARMGDPIAHINKDLGLFGAIGGVLLGAAAAVAVGVFVVATFGTGLVVVAAAAAVAGAAGGLVGGAVAGFASTAGQYGDNKGLIAEGSPNVFFEGKPVARVGDKIECSDHPGPKEKIAEGAKTVYANGKQIARIGHRTTCDANINDGAKTIVETMETAQVFEIKDSRSPYLRWANVIVNLLPLPRGKKSKAQESSSGTGCSANKCTRAGEPVDVGTGDFLQEWPVLHIPGPLPLSLNRLYRSTAEFSGLFGAKWADDWSQHLVIHDDHITYHSAQGYTLDYHTPQDQVLAVNLREGQWSLSGSRSGILRLYDRQTQRILTFAHRLKNAQGQTQCRLSDIEDLNGHRIHFHYSGPHLVQIDLPDGSALSILTTAAGHLERIKWLGADTSGQGEVDLLRCTYDSHGYLASLHSYQFGSLHHTYNPQGWMTDWADSDRTRAHITYDSRGRVTATQTAEGHYNDRFDYDDTQHLTRYLDAEGGQTTYWRNADGLITKTLDANGHLWHTQWSDTTQRLQDTDPLGRSTTYQYNDFSELTHIHWPDGSSRTISYNTLGQVSQLEDTPLGGTWQYQHDPHGNLQLIIDPQDKRTSFRRGDKGQLLRQDNPDGTQTRWDYDHKERPVRYTRADGTTYQLQVDSFGRLQRSTDPLGHTTTYHYEAGHAHPRGSVSRIVRPDGQEEHYTYNSEHLLIAHRNALGHVSTYRYGPFDILEQTNAAHGQAISLQHDQLTRLTGVTNGVGDTYRYAYDPVGQLTQETDYSGLSTQYHYNPAGWLTQTVLPDGSQIHYDYDKASARLLQVKRYTKHTDAQGKALPAIQDTTRLIYDDLGRLQSLSNADATIDYQRDDAGRIIQETLNGRSIHYRYDPKSGRPQGMAIGDEKNSPQTIHWQFDVNGALKTLQVSQGDQAHQPLHITRDALGRDIQRHSPAGFTLQQRFDPLNLLIEQQAGGHTLQGHSQHSTHPGSMPNAHVISGQWGGNGPAVQRQYQYDAALNPIHIQDKRWGSSRYTYDSHQQVIAAQLDENPSHPGITQTYAYDGAANLIGMGQSQAGQHQGVQHRDIQQKAGKVIRQGSDTYRYDHLGRLAEKTVQRDGFRPQTWRYRWNSENRLIELITPDNERWRYAYDALGRRIRKFKVIQNQAESTPTPPSHSKRAHIIGEQYLWAGDQLIEAAPIYADGTVAFDQATQWAYAPGGITPLAQSQRGQLWYVVSDHIGTPRELLDETGEVAWSNSPKLWGQQRLWQRKAANDDTSVDCPIRFPGQYFDAESGLHYNRHRYYDPETAQYLTPDPLGLAGGFRPQGYVHNPNAWVDPLGLSTVPSYDDLIHMATHTLDFSTARDGAVFWSGPNMKSAQNWASGVGKTTLEQTVGGKYLDSLGLFSKMDGAKAAHIWDIASKRFAEGASGDVHVFSTKAKRIGPFGERTWWRIEKPALLANANVERIIRMRKNGVPVKCGK